MVLWIYVNHLALALTYDAHHVHHLKRDGLPAHFDPEEQVGENDEPARDEADPLHHIRKGLLQAGPCVCRHR